MKDNRFYVPTIEEFRVGFRYELNSKDYVNGIYQSCWIKTEYNKGDDYGNDIVNLETNLELENIRTKVLDEEDILELGFITSREYSHWFDIELEKNNFARIHYSRFEDTFPHLSIDKILRNEDDTLTHFQVFRGQVKNYNELEVILKQIGI